MERAIIIKAVIFIILALFASWPYFEKFKEYSPLKRALIGLPIVGLLLMGCYDILDTDRQSKDRDTKMSNKIDSIGKKQDSSFSNLETKLNSHLQEDQGNISKTVKHKKHRRRKS